MLPLVRGFPASPSKASQHTVLSGFGLLALSFPFLSTDLGNSFHLTESWFPHLWNLRMDSRSRSGALGEVSTQYLTSMNSQ